MPKVSVVIPSYNRPKFLIEAIENLKEQTYRDMEILVIDSSTDNTEELLQPYMQDIRYVFQKKQAYEALKFELEAQVKQAMQQQLGAFTGFRIDVEKQPQFQTEWRRREFQLDSQYLTLLEEYRQELAAIT